MQNKNYKYFDVIMALFVAVLLISNIASTKIVELWHFTFDAGTLLFPFSYIFGDILTEIYGYAHARRVIWVGVFCAGLMSIVLMIVNVMPAAADWPNQEAFNAIFGSAPRIILASLIAYFVGAFSNSFILAKLKMLTHGKLLWFRTISSTIIGEAIDTALFVTIAFAGVLPSNLLFTIFVSNYIFKCGVEVGFTPVTYRVVRFLKRKENEDYYDYKTNFSPFKTTIDN